MTDFYFTTATLGVGLAVSILYLVRKDHLYLRDGIFWVLVAFSALLLGLFPSLIDRLGSLAGIAYPPTLILTLVVVVLLIKALHADVVSTQTRRDLRRLNQKLALIEFELSRTCQSSDDLDIVDHYPADGG
jgi:hypothetical protein